ncbi:hypothetical protein VNO80_29493 [Phaseolus coccineus]|uniref:Uncharacterized protein n=1 Tax=Phaseolus coccineus TaxID=3886 RepID=A0AAN9LG12_PHACN
MKARSESRSERGTKMEQNENVSILVSFYPYVLDPCCVFHFPIKYTNYFNFAQFDLSIAAASVHTRYNLVFSSPQNSTYQCKCH